MCLLGASVLVIFFILSQSLGRMLSHTTTKSNSFIYSDAKNIKDHSEGNLDPHSHEHSHPDYIPDLQIPNINMHFMENIERIILIPGGGGGAPGTADEGYPEWTKRRVLEAFKYYQALPLVSRERTLFLLLSAGSLNSPNLLLADKRIMFECQHMIQHLTQLGIEKERIHGDIFSWDTVTNGLSLRLFLEGLLLYQTEKMVEVDLFISDFHSARMQTTLQWVLGLQPSLLESRVTLKTNVVHSRGIQWKSPSDFQDRVKHEEKGLQLILAQSKKITRIHEFHAFLMLGGHLGIRKYLMSDYVKSKGGGW